MRNKTFLHTPSYDHQHSQANISPQHSFHNPPRQLPNLLTRTSCLNSEHIILILRRRLQALKLRSHHIILHIVVLASPHAIHKKRFRGSQENEVHSDVGVFEGSEAQDVAVFAFEGGAG